MRRLQSIENRALPFLFSGFLLLLWYVVIVLGLVKDTILPYPHEVIQALIEILPSSVPHILATLKEALIGFVLSIIFAVLLAWTMDSISIIKKAVYPWLIVSQTIPIIALAPLFVIWFGFGILPKIIVVMLVCFFPISISLMEGLDSVDSDMLNLLKSMGANKRQLFRWVKLPSAMMSLFSGLRIAVTYSVMGAVIGEWLGGESGLGMRLMYYKRSYSVDKTFATILIIALFSMLLFKIVERIQHVAMPWQELMNKKYKEEA